MGEEKGRQSRGEVPGTDWFILIDHSDYAASRLVAVSGGDPQVLLGRI